MSDADQSGSGDAGSRGLGGASGRGPVRLTNRSFSLDRTQNQVVIPRADIEQAIAAQQGAAQPTSSLAATEVEVSVKVKF